MNAIAPDTSRVTITTPNQTDTILLVPNFMPTVSYKKSHNFRVMAFIKFINEIIEF
jgi:hypothetical protein